MSVSIHDKTQIRKNRHIDEISKTLTSPSPLPPPCSKSTSNDTAQNCRVYDHFCTKHSYMQHLFAIRIFGLPPFAACGHMKHMHINKEMALNYTHGSRSQRVGRLSV